MDHSNNNWLTLMYEVQKFTRSRLTAKELISDFADRLSEQELQHKATLLRLADPEIRTALQLLVPGLLVDFLMTNPDLLDGATFEKWSRRKDDEHQRSI